MPQDTFVGSDDGSSSGTDTDTSTDTDSGADYATSDEQTATPDTGGVARDVSDGGTDDTSDDPDPDTDAGGDSTPESSGPGGPSPGPGGDTDDGMAGTPDAGTGDDGTAGTPDAGVSDGTTDADTGPARAPGSAGGGASTGPTTGTETGTTGMDGTGTDTGPAREPGSAAGGASTGPTPTTDTASASPGGRALPERATDPAADVTEEPSQRYATDRDATSTQAATDPRADLVTREEVDSEADARRYVAQQVEAQYGDLDQGEDYRVVQTDEGGYRAELTQRGRQVIAIDRASEMAEQQYPELNQAEDYVIHQTEDGARIEFTESGRREMLSQQYEGGAQDVEFTQLSDGAYRADVDPDAGTGASPGPGAGGTEYVATTEEGASYLESYGERREAYADVGREMTEIAVESERVEAGQDARRRREAAAGALERGNFGDPRDIAREQARARADDGQDGAGTGAGAGSESQLEEAYGGDAPTLDELEQTGTVPGQSTVTQQPSMPLQDSSRGAAASAAAVADAALLGAPSQFASAVQAEAARPDNEQFGHAELQLPNSNVAVEDVLTVTSEGITNFAQSTGETVGSAVPGDDDSPAARLTEGVVSGGIQLANLPAFGLAAKEAGEAAGHLFQNPDRIDDAGEFAYTVGERAAGYAEQNPYQTFGMVAGSVAGSGIAVAAAGRYSATAGRRVALLTEPGEQLAESGVTRALGQTATGRRVLQRLPNQRAGIENVAIAAGRGVRNRARGAVNAARARFATPDGAGGPRGTFTESADAPTGTGADAGVSVTRAERDRVATRVQAAEGSSTELGRAQLASGMADETTAPPQFGRPSNTGTARTANPTTAPDQLEATGPRGGQSEPLGSGGTGTLYPTNVATSGDATPSTTGRIGQAFAAARANLRQFQGDTRAQGNLLGGGRGDLDDADGGTVDLDEPRGDPTRPPDAGGTFEDVRDDALTQIQSDLETRGARERAAETRRVDPDVDPIGSGDATQATIDPDEATSFENLYGSPGQRELTDAQEYLSDVAMREQGTTPRGLAGDADPIGSDRPQAVFEQQSAYDYDDLYGDPDAQTGSGTAGDVTSEATERIEAAESTQVVEEGSILDREGVDTAVRVDGDESTNVVEQGSILGQSGAADTIRVDAETPEVTDATDAGIAAAEAGDVGVDDAIDADVDVLGDTDTDPFTDTDTDVDTGADTGSDAQLDTASDISADVDMDMESSFEGQFDDPTAFEFSDSDASMSFDSNQQMNVRTTFNANFARSSGRRSADFDFDLDMETERREIPEMGDPDEKTFASGILRNPLEADLL